MVAPTESDALAPQALLPQDRTDFDAWRQLAASRSAELEAAMERDGDLALRLCRFVADKG